MRRRRARAAVAWAAALAAAAQVSLALALECGPARWRDPEFGRRLDALRACHAALPGRPVWVALGSSRMAMALRPAALAGRAGGPLVFNFGQVKAGPVGARLWLERLLAAGVRPERVVVEVWPPFAVPGEIDAMDATRLAAADVAALARPGVAARWAAARLVPWHAHRHLLLAQAAPDWQPAAVRRDAVEWAFDAWGTLYWPDLSARRAAFVARDRGHLVPRVACAPVPGPDADAGTRATLARARSAGAAVTVVWLPESSELRSWYAPANRASAAAWLADLAREAGVAVIDARDWACDAHMQDASHLTAAGAEAFTRRLGRHLGIDP